MRNTNKKGFTIVELVIVVAVIAILAAVLIPTFSGIIKKAQLSADQKAERDMNTALAIEMNPKDIDAAIDALIANGFNGNNLVPVSKGYIYVWSKTEYTIALIEENTFDETKHVNLADGIKYIDVVAKTEADLANAIANGSENIKLDTDVVINSAIVVPVGSNIVLDLNGKTLSAPATGRPFELTNGSSLTINAGDSTVNCGQYGLVNILSGVTASVTLNGGNYIANTDNGAFIKVRQGEGNVNVTLNNVNYVDSSDDGYLLNTKGYTGNLTFTINGGTYKADGGFQTMGNVTIKDAKITTESVSITVSGGTAEITNCEITTGSKKDSSAPAAAIAVANNATANVSNCKLDVETNEYCVYSSGGKIVAKNNTGNNNFNNTVTSLYTDHDKTIAYVEIDGVVKVNETYTK